MTGKLSEPCENPGVPVACFGSERVRTLAEERVNFHLLRREEPFRVVIDSRGEVNGAVFIGLPGENHDGSKHACEAMEKGAVGVVVSGGVWGRVRDMAEKRGRAAIYTGDPLYFLGELAREKRQRSEGTTFIGITGSAGKTTTKDMVHAVLAGTGKTLKNPGNFNNLIGLPLSLLMAGGDEDYAVLEMGTNTPGEIGRLTEILSPHVGVITNVGPAHLEGLGGVDGVKEEKGDLFRNLAPGAVAVVNGDDLRVRAVADCHPGRKVIYGETGGDVTGAIRNLTLGTMEISIRYGGHDVDVTMVASGFQFFKNALCTGGISHALEISPEILRRGLSTFRPDSGRFQTHLLAGDVVLVDDAYNSNPLSVEVAVTNIRMMFPGRKPIFLLGDMLELGEASESSHLRIGDLTSSLNPHMIFTFGELAKKIREGALSAGFPELRCLHFEDIESLTDTLMEEAVPGSVILVKGSRMMRLERVVRKLVDGVSIRGESA